MLNLLGGLLVLLSVLLVITALRHNMAAPEGMSTAGVDTIIIAAVVGVIGVALWAV